MKDKEIVNLLGITDTTIHLDLENIVKNGLDIYMQDLEDEKNKRNEFIRLFKEYYNEYAYYGN